MWGDVWHGGTVVVMASGPSLTKEDVEMVRKWRESGEGRYVIVTNTTFQLAHWADALFFHDMKWWRQYRDEVRAKFRGRMVTVASVNAADVDWLRGWNSYGNSGAAAIARPSPARHGTGAAPRPRPGASGSCARVRWWFCRCG